MATARPAIRPDAAEALALPFDTVLDLLPTDTAPAISSTDGRTPLTFSRLSSQSRSLDLASFGIARSDRVAVAIPNGPEAASALLAFAHACAYAPLNPRLTQAELAFEFEDLPAKAVVVQRGERENDNGLRVDPILEVARAMGLPVLVLIPSACVAGAWTLQWLERPLPPLAVAAPGSDPSSRRHDVCLVLHTSGTSAKPKLVPLTHENLAVGSSCIAAALRIQRRETSLSLMPLFHIHGA